MALRISWLGHASVLVEVDGARLLTDPVLRGRVTHLRRHGPLPAFPEGLDAVLISHAHYDHLDRPTLRRLAAPGVAAVLPAGAGRLLAGMPFGAVHELRAGERAEIGGVRVEAVPAWHDGRRHPGAAPLEALGYRFARVWFAGDTDLHPDMAALRGSVDIALVPIWGWGPSLGPGHMDPERAAQAIALVAPAIAIPIHWGTFLPIGMQRSHADLLTEPPLAFAAHVRALAPATRVEIVPVGGSLTA